MDKSSMSPRKALIGNPRGNFWLYDTRTGFDLTHPLAPNVPTTPSAITVKTTSAPITIDPAKSAFVVIDMQNFFLSTALGRSPDSKGLKVQKSLLELGIPAARKAGIRIVWINWGLTQEEIDAMPPVICRVFGFETIEASEFDENVINDTNHASGPGRTKTEIETSGKSPRIYKGLGAEMGDVKLANGVTRSAGRVLMRDQWNTELTPELSLAYYEGLSASPPDVWIHKNRLSGFWGESSAATRLFDDCGIKTLFFAGVNTDQCVGGSLSDAFSKGYDCILLSDGTATSSPSGSQECYEFNAAKTYGFCTSCRDLWDAVGN